MMHLKSLKKSRRGKKMNRGQISAQVFIYILAAVVIGLILIVGYRSISTIMNEAQKAPIDTFKAAFTSTVAEMSRGYGSIKKYSFTIPQKFDQICFIDSMGEDEKFHITASIDNDWISDKVTDNVRENVFLMNNGLIENDAPFYVEDLDVLGDYLCLKNQGKLSVWFEATGKFACLKKEKTDTC
ncbi:MAG: hypothetical protein ABIJ34_00665 [archaeon]